MERGVGHIIRLLLTYDGGLPGDEELVALRSTIFRAVSLTYPDHVL